MFSHNRTNWPESKMMHVLSSSPGGGTEGKVCHLWLHLIAYWKLSVYC